MSNPEIIGKIKHLLRNEAQPTVLIHSDLMHGFQLPFKNRNEFLALNYNELCKLGDDIKIWMPAFNYDFCKGLDFNVNTTKSQVGVLPEYFRNNAAEWRTGVPVFSFCGTGNKPGLDSEGIIDPFDAGSAFDFLYKSDSWLMHYGAVISSSTILHYAERISNSLVYRYDKIFNGVVIDSKNNSSNVSLRYHVRPMGKHLDYDWTKIEKDLIEENILNKFDNGVTRILICKIAGLIDFWVAKMREDPFYLLDTESKGWVLPCLDKLGRPFEATDFESP